MSAPGPDRRQFLATSVGLLATALAGCAERVGTQPAPSEPSEPPEVATGPRTVEPTPRGTVPGPESDSEPGLRLPSLTAPGSPGGPLDVAPAGRVVVLDFFATWCPPCEVEMANLRAVRTRFDHGSVFVVSLTQETDQRGVVDFWTEHGGTWPVVQDPTLTAVQTYGVRSLPTIVVLARDGTETFRHVGLAGEDRLVTAVEAALGRREG